MLAVPVASHMQIAEDSNKILSSLLILRLNRLSALSLYCAMWSNISHLWCDEMDVQC